MKRLLLVPALLVAACDSPTVPARPLASVYDFRLATTPLSVLRWPSGTRVRVFVQGAPGMREDVLANAFARGAAEWNRHALYGGYELVRAGNIAQADVLLRWSDEVLPVDMAECLPDVSIAVTTFCLGDNPSHLYVFPLLPPNSGSSSVRFVVTILGTEATRPDGALGLVTHELGHVLGIAAHSPNTSDLMAAGVPNRTTLSLRDIATIHVLYHTVPAITP